MPLPVDQLSPLASLAPLDSILTLAAAPYGEYLSWWKALLFVIVFMVWFQLMLWIDKDTVRARMPREPINAGMWVLLLAATIAAILVPTFVISFILFTAIFVLSISGYLIWRNSVVGLADIPDQLGSWFKNLFKSKRARRQEQKEEAVAEGMLTVMDSRGNVPPVPPQDDPQRPAYEASHRILLDPLYKGAERIVFADAGNRYATKYRVDGVDYPGMAVEPDAASATVDYVKNLAGMEVGERRKRQTGNLKVRTAAATHEIEVQSSGTRTGETLVFEVDRATRFKQRATALGMTQQQRDLLAEAVADNNGIVLAAAPPGGGLSALLYGLVQEHDAFVQHIITLERPIERELEGVTQNTLPSGTDAVEEARQIGWIADQMPDVFMATYIESREGTREAIRLAGEERRRVYLGLRASDTADAINRWRSLVGDTKTALSRLEMVIAGRSLRKLCDACKTSYTPSDQVLAKMGLPRGKVQTLFRARTEPMLDQRGNPVPCEFCGQLGYRGRMGVFEMLRIDPATRKALVQDPSPAAVRNALRAQKLPTLNEAALRAVVAGRTDLQEVQRVMTPPAAAASRRAAAAPPAPAAQPG